MSKTGKKFRGILQRLIRNNNGLALTEFAYALPIFTGLGMFGLEIAHLTVTQLRVSQAALNLSDNASRMGQSGSSSTAKTVNESDVNQMLTGTGIQGAGIDIYQNGRVILSSLEVDSSGNQFIRWQRCRGAAPYNTAYYNPDTDSRPGGFAGMGSGGTNITASSGSAVMFVEIIYEYDTLFGDMFFDERIIRHQAAFNVRDSRNLSAGVADDGSAKATCGTSGGGGGSDDD